MTDQPRPDFNVQTELAKQRNRAAADRTLLAWIRSGITLISFGAGLDQILKALYSYPRADLTQPADLAQPADLTQPASLTQRADPEQLIHALNLALIGLGTVILLLAISDYRDQLRRFEQPTYRYTPRLTIGMVVTPLLIYLAIGAFAVIWMETAP